MKTTEGAPKQYPLTPIASVLGENEDFDKFVRELCQEIKDTADEREKTLEPVWEDCENNYWANAGPDHPRESDLDFPITFQTCRQASSHLTNPIFAQDQIFVAKARPGYPSVAATHDILLDWVADQSDYISFVNDMIRHAQIYTKAVGKSPYVVKTRRVRYWERDEKGEPYEEETEHVLFEGSSPYVCSPWRIYHPIPCPNIDEAPWWAEKFDTTVAEARMKIKDGYYRQDLFPESIGLEKQNPMEDKKREELFVANQLETTEINNRTDRSKLTLYECYTSFEGAECVIILDLDRETWVAAHSPFYQEFPRPYVSFSWHQVTGSIDGKSLCGVLDQLHRAYTAIMNILLDAGVRAIEPLVLARKELKLGERMKDGRLGPGLQEVERLVLDKLSDGIHEIKLTTGQVTFLLELLMRIEQHFRDASSIPEAFFGKEVADRPTATGTSSVLEKAMQPLYELMGRFRKVLIRTIEIQYSQYRQFFPKSLRIFIENQMPNESSMLQSMLVEWPAGYWRDQVVLETKVNSQTMSKSIKKQEALAMVDKWPMNAEVVLKLGEAVTSGAPIAPIAGNMLDVYDLVLAEWLTEFELPEVRDALDIQGAKLASESVAQMYQKLQGIIEDQARIIVDREAQIVDMGGTVPQGAQSGGGRLGPGQSQAA